MLHGFTAINTGFVNYIQMPYSVFDQRGNIEGFIKKAKKSGIKIFTRSAFLQGLFMLDEGSIPLAQAMLPGCGMPEVGIREGEKLHEVMVTKEDSATTYEYDRHFIIYPHYVWWGEKGIIDGGKPVEQGFEYSSGTNNKWLDVEMLKQKITML